MSYYVFTVLISSLAPAVGPLLGALLGFLSGWGLFVLQENRKQTKAAEATRQSLIGELKWLESYLNVTIMKCAIRFNIIDRRVKEAARWYMKHGLEFNALDQIPPSILEERDKLLASGSDDELVTWLSSLPQQENRASEAPLTTTNAILSAPFSARLEPSQLRKLIDVKWQSTLLNAEARNANEWLRLTFTVTGETNYPRVKENHEGCLRTYGLRASYALDYVRAALSELDKK